MHVTLLHLLLELLSLQTGFPRTAEVYSAVGNGNGWQVLPFVKSGESNKKFFVAVARLGTKVVFCEMRKILAPAQEKTLTVQQERKKTFYFMYSGFLQCEELVLHQLLKMFAPALRALPTLSCL